VLPLLPLLVLVAPLPRLLLRLRLYVLLLL
jgi:hypothetical protein